MTETTAIVTRPANGVQPAPAPSSPLPQENLVSGFDGMATQAFSKEVTAILRAPFPHEDVEIRTDGIVYLPGMFYRQRLTDAFGPGGWAIAPRSPAKRAPAQGGELVIYHGALYCQGRFVAEAAGQCKYFPNSGGMTYADAWEGAKTDAITRCCKDLLIASELWDPTWREQWQAKYAFKDRDGKWRKKEGAQGQKLASPPAAKTSAPPASSAKTAAGSATAAAPTSDDGEAMAAEDVKNLEGLLREMGWKRGWAKIWFKRRFAVDYTSLSKEQHKTACKLLFAFAQGPDKYNAELAAQAGAGKCHGATEEEVTAP